MGIAVSRPRTRAKRRPLQIYMPVINRHCDKNNDASAANIDSLFATDFSSSSAAETRPNYCSSCGATTVKKWLPKKMWNTIFAHLGPEDIIALRETSRKLRFMTEGYLRGRDVYIEVGETFPDCRINHNVNHVMCIVQSKDVWKCSFHPLETCSAEKIQKIRDGVRLAYQTRQLPCIDLKWVPSLNRIFRLSKRLSFEGCRLKGFRDVSKGIYMIQHKFQFATESLRSLRAFGGSFADVQSLISRWLCCQSQPVCPFGNSLIGCCKPLFSGAQLTRMESLCDRNDPTNPAFWEEFPNLECLTLFLQSFDWRQARSVQEGKFCCSDDFVFGVLLALLRLKDLGSLRIVGIDSRDPSLHPNKSHAAVVLDNQLNNLKGLCLQLSSVRKDRRIHTVYARQILRNIQLHTLEIEFTESVFCLPGKFYLGMVTATLPNLKVLMLRNNTILTGGSSTVCIQKLRTRVCIGVDRWLPRFSSLTQLCISDFDWTFSQSLGETFESGAVAQLEELRLLCKSPLLEGLFDLGKYCALLKATCHLARLHRLELESVSDIQPRHFFCHPSGLDFESLLHMLLGHMPRLAWLKVGLEVPVRMMLGLRGFVGREREFVCIWCSRKGRYRSVGKISVEDDE